MVVAQDDELDVAVQVMLSLSLLVVTEVGGVSLRLGRRERMDMDATEPGRAK